MSSQFHHTTIPDKPPARWPSFPRSLANATASLTKTVFGRKVEPSPAALVHDASNVPHVTPNPKYDIADRTYCKYFGDLKVSFYYYIAHQCYRAVARKGTQVRQVDFTQALAAQLDVPFSLDSAIAYVREYGFKKAQSAGVNGAVPSPSAPALAPAGMIDVSAPVASSPAPARKANTTPRIEQTSASSKSRPFTGHVVSMGESVRPGRGDKPSYTTYVVKLRSESGGMEREFIGEHLSELVDAKAVKAGQLVRIQLLGRSKFEVLNNGKLEERTRNEYALHVL